MLTLLTLVASVTFGVTARTELRQSSGDRMMRRIRRPFVIVAALAAVAALSTGCASKPTMHVNHAEVAGVQMGFPPSLNVVLTLVVDVTNPNSYDVAVRAMRGTVVIANSFTMPLDYRAPGDGLWLYADKVTQVRIPVTMPVDLAMRLLQMGFSSPNIPFHVIGHADVTATRSLQIEKDNYEVDEDGVVSRDAIQASVQSVFFPGGMRR